MSDAQNAKVLDVLTNNKLISALVLALLMATVHGYAKVSILEDRLAVVQVAEEDRKKTDLTAARESGRLEAKLDSLASDVASIKRSMERLAAKEK